MLATVRPTSLDAPQCIKHRTRVPQQTPDKAPHHTETVTPHTCLYKGDLASPSRHLSSHCKITVKIPTSVRSWPDNLFISGGNPHLTSRFCGVVLGPTTISNMVPSLFTILCATCYRFPLSDHPSFMFTHLMCNPEREGSHGVTVSYSSVGSAFGV
ncbi:hypothetical protein MTR_6g074890 [Medicago truncatula]|uniref:Uncharacterized protein n=1 Tax=Medicago truncatula TaxID=3880 RepID=G7KJN6_MEDTR|nr:hypothetical protein MTR_6g074890 [Medicago truncatula]